MSETASGASRVRRPGDYVLVLPGTWSFIPMTDAEHVRRRVAQIVKQRMPKGDKVAKLRLESRRELERAALEALDNDATVMAMAFEILEGVPFAASVIGADADWPEGMPRADEDLAQQLQELLPGSVPVEHAFASVVRRSEPRITKAERDELVGIDLEYWLARPGRRLSTFRIGVPVNPDDELITDFFDAVIATLTWKDMGSPLHSQTT